MLEILHSELQPDLVRTVDDPMSRGAYEQLMNLGTEFRDTGIVYKCLPGQHDDLGISCAMLAWAARHPHLSSWTHAALAPRRTQEGRTAMQVRGLISSLTELDTVSTNC